VVDDACPEESGRLVAGLFDATSVTVLCHTANQGVGAAMVTCYRQALHDGHRIVVKMDGDGQMDPDYLTPLIAPILRGDADYTKGNRFFDVRLLRAMPRLRLIGNACLSSSPSCPLAIGTSWIPPMASPRSAVQRWTNLISTGSTSATSSRRTCCSGSR
jgi:glycosyltransferase involved in cell wall biosynthesis